MGKLKNYLLGRCETDPDFVEVYYLEQKRSLHGEPDYPDEVEYSTSPLTDSSSSAELPF